MYVYMSKGVQLASKDIFYTMRQRWYESVPVSDGEGGTVSILKERDWHVQNLSIDYAKAYDKFRDIAKSDFPKAKRISPNLAAPTGVWGENISEWEKYERENAEAIRAARADAKAAKELEAKIKLDMQKEAGVLISGKYMGLTAQEVHDTDLGYFYWLADQNDELIIYLVSQVDFIEKDNNAELEMGELDDDLIFISFFCFDGFYGETRVNKFFTPEGAEVVWFSNSKLANSLEEGKRYKTNLKITDYTVERNSYKLSGRGAKFIEV